MLVVIIMINCYYNFNKTKSIFDNFKKMIEIDIKRNINFDKSIRKIYLISDVRFFVILIKIEKNINLAYFCF